MVIHKSFTFDSAHSLPNVPDGHKCKNIHGHTYHENVKVLGNRLYIDTRANLDAIYKNYAMTILQYIPDNKGEILGMFREYRFKRNEDGEFGFDG